MGNELLPCPFCGGEAEMLTAESMHGGNIYGVMCANCAGRSDIYDTEAEAIAAWNTRAEYHGYEQAAIEAWESIKKWNTRAELGSGTLTSEQVREAIERNFTKVAVIDDGGEKVEWREGWVCNVGINYKAIADELNAKLGSGTCAMIPSFIEPKTLNDCQEFCCSDCGEYMVLQQFPGCVDDAPNYCPNCGGRAMRND